MFALMPTWLSLNQRRAVTESGPNELRCRKVQRNMRHFIAWTLACLLLTGMGCAEGGKQQREDVTRNTGSKPNPSRSVEKMAIVHNNEGIRLYRQGDLEGAVREFREAIRLIPNDALLRNNLGIALQAQGDLSGAIAEFIEVLTLNPRFAEARNKLAFAFFERGDLQSAVGQWQAAVRLYPHLTDAWAGLALALFALGLQEQAVQSFCMALHQDRRYADVRYLQEVHGWSSGAIRQAEAILGAMKTRSEKVAHQRVMI